MAKTWYPVIDYLTCAECGTCVATCPHGVYDSAKALSPIVKNPDACIDHCHGWRGSLSGWCDCLCWRRYRLDTVKRHTGIQRSLLFLRMRNIF